MEPNNDAAKEAARHAYATNAPAARVQPLSPDDIHDRFSYHPALSETRRRNHNHVRELCERLAMALCGNVPQGRELALAITSLEQVSMWANAGLARAADPEADATVYVASAVERAQRAYDAYGAVTEHKNFRGDPMPAWDSLGDTIQAAWIAAATVGGNQ